MGVSRTMHFLKRFVFFITLKPLFYSRFFYARFVPVFWGVTNWAKMVHIVASRLNRTKKTKTPETTIFLLGFAAKHGKQFLLLGVENRKTLLGHIRVLCQEVNSYKQKESFFLACRCFLLMLLIGSCSVYVLVVVVFVVVGCCCSSTYCSCFCLCSTYSYCLCCCCCSHITTFFLGGGLFWFCFCLLLFCLLQRPQKAAIFPAIS